MKSLKELLTNLFADAFEACKLDRKFGQVVASQRPDLSQFQCSGALAVASVEAKNPRKIAQGVLDALGVREMFVDVSVAGPGFINITLSDDFLAYHVQNMAEDQRLGCSPMPNPKTVVMDFGGPNVAKAMHVGHLRSTIIGDSLQRLFRFMGDRVISDIHLGDWGTQMGMLICELRRRRPDLPYFDGSYVGPYPDKPPVTIEGLEEMYPVAYARRESDAKEMEAALLATVELQQGRPGYRALWRHFVEVSANALKDDFGNLGVNFDLWLGESHYHDRIRQMIERLKSSGLAQMSEGAVVIPLAPASDEKEIPPLILVKSDGGFLYGTTDLATIEERARDFQADQILYVVDKRQCLHFEQVFRAARQTGIARDVKLEHIAFGTVNGPDGKPFKTRSGGVMKLQDLIFMAADEALKRMEEVGVAEGYGEAERRDIARKVGIAALKFADLINHRSTDYVFDIERFTKFEGRTGPYHLYAAVRIKSILRKAEENGIVSGSILPPTGLDRDLMLELCKFHDVLQNAYLRRAPNHLGEFAYDLAQTFSRFYQKCHILSEEDPSRQSSWLALSQLSLRQLELTLFLLGIETPDRM